MLRRLLLIAGLAALLGLALLGFAYWQALQPPIIRRAMVTVPDWPAGEPPHTVLLISDVHVDAPVMPPERLARIVTQLNGLKPDLILMAGDFVGRKMSATEPYGAEQVVATLSGLRARFGLVAVLGNHDHWAIPRRCGAPSLGTTSRSSPIKRCGAARS